MYDIFDTSANGIKSQYIGGETVTAGNFVVGRKYKISTIGTTDFTAIGATSNTQFDVFTATGAGSGTGTAQNYTGWLKRHQELMESNSTHASNPLERPQYKTHGNPTARIYNEDGLSAQNEMAKHYRYYDDRKELSELQMYDFWKQPLPQAKLRVKGVQIQDISTEREGNYARIVFETKTAHGFTGTESLEITQASTAVLNNAENSSRPLRHIAIDSTNFSVKDFITGSDIHEEYDISFLRNSPYDVRIDDGDAKLIRNGSGVLLFSTSIAGGINRATGDIIRLSKTFQDTAHTGTANAIDTNFYMQRESTNNTFVYELYTDVGRTTPATVTETYYHTTSFDRVFTSGTYQLSAVTNDSIGMSDAEWLGLPDEGWVRLTATVGSGSFTGADSCTKTIGTSLDYSINFAYNKNQVGDVRYLNIKDWRNDIAIAKGLGNATAADFIVTGGSTSINFKFIKPATPAYDPDSDSGQWFVYQTNNTTDQDAFVGSAGTYEIDDITLWFPGNRTFFYKNSSNVDTPGAQYITGWYLPYTAKTLLGGSESMPADSTINVDSSGYLTGFTFPSPGAAHPDRGSFNSYDGGRRVLQIFNADGQYTAPATLTAGVEDVFDTQDEWNTLGFDTGKTWPTHVLPSSAKLTYNQPSQVTVGQTGIKYVRNLDFTKWQLEVAYPPMTASQFQIFHSCAQRARGQYIPFYFDIIKNSVEYMFPFSDPNTPSLLRLREDAASTDRLVLLEGFGTDNKTINDGELIIFGTGRNGNIRTIVSPVSSNAFGEARVRLAYPVAETLETGAQAYLKPTHLIVTLADDAFEYDIDSAQHYRVSVKFDLDEFK